MKSEKQIYMAPMEGLTDYIYRSTFHKYYGGVDKYYTPFISPNQTHSFITKEKGELNPANNEGMHTVPQLLTNNAEHFLWALGEIRERGYTEVNLNLGCPSGTVTAKKKGSGLLAYPELLEGFLEDIFAAPETQNMRISVKSRLGYENPEEFYRILEIYNRYPIYELTLHPRIKKDMYKPPVRKEYFTYAYENTGLPLIYNGDLNTEQDIYDLFRSYENVSAVMLGRGLVANPELALSYRQQETAGVTSDFAYTPNRDMRRLQEFSEELLARYIERLSGNKPILGRMKEFWGLMLPTIPHYENYQKKILKSKTVEEFERALDIMFLSLH